jgi:hypothetical protein
MNINLALGVAIFFLGTAAGALLTRFQWMAFKQRVSQEMIEQLGAVLSAERGPVAVAPSDAANLTYTYRDDSYPASPAPPIEEHAGEEMSLDMITDPTFRILLNQKQMEIARTREESRTLRAVIPLLEDAPEGAEQSIYADCPDERPSLLIRYASWLRPGAV